MDGHSTTPCVLFEDLFDKPVHAHLDQTNDSSDGGAILLKAADRRLGLIDRLSGCLTDRRQPGKVDHGIQDLLSRSIFALAAGYPNANDAARLADDPIHLLLAG